MVVFNLYSKDIGEEICMSENIIKIQTFKAKSGDAFLLSFGVSEEYNIMIDMGFIDTYSIQIEKELIALSQKGKSLDLLIITHIDADHIGGALKFIENNGKNNKIIQVDDIWHNSYRHLQFNKKKSDSIAKEERLSLESIIRQNPPLDNTNGTQKISYKQGSSLAAGLLRYKYNWNGAFNNRVVSTKENITKNIGDISIIILSPSEEKLQKLATKWLDELEKKKYKFAISDDVLFDDAFEFYMQYQKETSMKISKISSYDKLDIEMLSKEDSEDTDLSVTNGSSLAFILEYKGKKLLFLGDAHEDIIYNNLKILQNDGYGLYFDLIKVSHHGSKKNISNKFMELIKSNKFLISTDGSKHNHPDMETLSKIIRKKTVEKKELIFNYKLACLYKFEDQELMNKYNYEIKHLNKVVV